MNAEDLLQCAPRLSESNRAYVLFNNGDRAIIVPPGASGKKITVRACDADGNQSGPVMKVLAKELRLEPLPAPPAPLRLAPWCVNCGNAATLRCMACGSSICGVPCATERWKQHRPECRRLQAVAFGEEYARKDDNGMRLNYAGLDGDISKMRRITIGLTIAVSKKKLVAKAGDAAMRALVAFHDNRMVATAAFSAAQENQV